MTESDATLLPFSFNRSVCAMGRRDAPLRLLKLQSTRRSDVSPSFSHISNGRWHAGSQHGGDGGGGGGGGGAGDTGEGSAVSHLITVPMETDGWRILCP